jgi:uncharacterized protein (TIGR02687 family)
MDVGQIDAELRRIFSEPAVRIVFWNDPEREFGETLSELSLESVSIVRLDEAAPLETKIRLERDDPAGRYLLYSPAEEPPFENDWLLDIRLYSRPFRADRASILLDELGLGKQHLRSHIALRRKFFDNKDRVRKLKQLVAPEDSELDLDRKMLAVVTRAEQPDLFNIIRTLFHSLADAEEIDLQVAPPAWELIERFELDAPFWAMVQAQFGYSEETPTLRNLLVRLLASDFVGQLPDGEGPVSLQNLVLPRSGAANAMVCLGQWRDSSSKGSSYNALASEVATLLQLPTILEASGFEQLRNVMTFAEVEKSIARGLLERVRGTADTVDAEAIRSIASQRQAGHWIGSSSILESLRKARSAVYDAITAAADFFSLRNAYREGFAFADATAMYRAYESDLFRFDQLYRRFCWSADVAGPHTSDLLKPLREDIEATYCNWYLVNLSQAWGRFVSGGLLSNWTIDGIQNQYGFFDRRVKPWIAEGENRRAFVIISDALRYEVAHEVTSALNGTYRFEAELSSMLGVLPSYTALGMASLLPHRTLEYKPNGDVIVDGQGTAGVDQRSNVLSRVQGMATKAGDLLAMKKEEGRQLIADRSVVYIYHDEIDARGDKLATESDTFDAAAKAVTDLVEIVTYAVNSLNGNYVVVTADHGFLFTETPPNETDKSKLGDHPAGTVKAKKRYLLGHGLPDGGDQAWHGRTGITAGAEGEMEFWIPKGTNRFHFTGGARFLHGGAMLQEVVVPVITVRHLKDKKAREKTRTRNVGVQVLGARHRITTPTHRFNMIQTEAVSDRAKPARLKIAIFLGDEAVSSSETVTFDSTSEKMDERHKWVMLTLQDREYDKKASYKLVLRDADTGIEQQSVDVIIDRAIADDFDF